MNGQISTTYTLEQITEAVRAALQPVLIYDASADQRRPVTQEDVDRLSLLADRGSHALRVLQGATSTRVL